MALSKGRAAVGASGVEASGSPLDALSFSAQNVEQDALLARHQGEVEATAYQNQATLQRYQGKTAQQASYLTAGSELLKGVGNAYGTGLFDASTWKSKPTTGTGALGQ
jgi:hypothetical protein